MFECLTCDLIMKAIISHGLEVEYCNTVQALAVVTVQMLNLSLTLVAKLLDGSQFWNINFFHVFFVTRNMFMPLVVTVNCTLPALIHSLTHFSNNNIVLGTYISECKRGLIIFTFLLQFTFISLYNLVLTVDIV